MKKMLRRVYLANIPIIILLINTNCLADTNTKGIATQTLYPFERLFTTPEHRLRLDRARRALAAVEKTSAVTSASEVKSEVKTAVQAELQTSSQIKLSGFMLRADGKYLVWINGRSELSDAPPNLGSGKPRIHSKTVPLRIQNQRITLKPGQVWQAGNEQKGGRVKEAYQVQQPRSEASTEKAETHVSEETNNVPP